MSIDRLRAVAANNAKDAPFAVSAAIDKTLLSLSRTLAQGGIELNSVNKISASTLSKKLKEAGIDSQRRIEVKIALDRAGLLAD
jgi:hypothetical protein